jgi:hypothetical protein
VQRCSSRCGEDTVRVRGSKVESDAPSASLLRSGEKQSPRVLCGGGGVCAEEKRGARGGWYLGERGRLEDSGAVFGEHEAPGPDGGVEEESLAVVWRDRGRVDGVGGELEEERPRGGEEGALRVRLRVARQEEGGVGQRR